MTSLVRVASIAVVLAGPAPPANAGGRATGAVDAGVDATVPVLAGSRRDAHATVTVSAAVGVSVGTASALEVRARIGHLRERVIDDDVTLMTASLGPQLSRRWSDRWHAASGVGFGFIGPAVAEGRSALTFDRGAVAWTQVGYALGREAGGRWHLSAGLDLTLFEQLDFVTAAGFSVGRSWR